MSLSTFDAFKTMTAADARELTADELRALQRTLAGILDDIAAVCEDEKIDYALGGGSALGACQVKQYGGLLVDSTIKNHDAGGDAGDAE